MRHAGLRDVVSSRIRVVAVLAGLVALVAVGRADAQVPPPLSAGDAAALRSAFELQDAKRWPEAMALTGRIYDPVAHKLVLWRTYREAPQPADFSELAAFIDQNPDWPGRTALLAQAEKALYQERGYRDVAGWLRRHPPVSGLGRVLQAEVLMAQGRVQDGIALIRESWAADGYPSDVEPELQARFGAYLRPSDYAARADRLLWDGNLNGAARLIAYLDPGQRALAQVRMQLIELAPQAGQAVGTLPVELRRDPGLLHDQLAWRRRRGMDSSAIGLLESLDGQTLSGAHAGAWWSERNALVRAALKDRDYRDAYRLASANGMKSGSDFVEAEWLAGWIALRFLNDPSAAYPHFVAVYKGSSKPISLGRGAYWAGRAAQAAGRSQDAAHWFAEGARYYTTFYGQLAAQAAGMTAPPPLPPTPIPPLAARQAFAVRETTRAARILADLNRDRYLRMFASQMVEAADGSADWVVAGRFFGAIGRSDLQVWIGKQAGYRHIVLPAIAYPSVALPATAGPDRALIHGVSRQESAFYPRAISGAGARGLMQLMPGTAQMMARQAGTTYSLGRLTSDPQYNMTLGAAYLQKMLDRFGGANVLAIAAYNAGPGRVDQWLGMFGDPRTGQIDMLDWIELIPITETRNYVQRVLENTQVYGQLLGSGDRPMRIHDDIYRGATAEPGAAWRPRLPS